MLVLFVHALKSLKCNICIKIYIVENKIEEMTNFYLLVGPEHFVFVQIHIVSLVFHSRFMAVSAVY